MTSMKDIKAMKDKDLSAFITEKREALRTLRFGTQNRDSASAKSLRTEIARALTELTARTKNVDNKQETAA